MQKRREIAIVVGFIFVIAFFSLVIYYSDHQTITGFAILTSQPNITNGKDTYLRELSSTIYGNVEELRLGTAATGGGRRRNGVTRCVSSRKPSPPCNITFPLSSCTLR